MRILLLRSIVGRARSGLLRSRLLRILLGRRHRVRPSTIPGASGSYERWINRRRRGLRLRRFGSHLATADLPPPASAPACFHHPPPAIGWEGTTTRRRRGAGLERRYDRLRDRSSGRRSGAAEIAYPPLTPIAAPSVRSGSRAAPVNCRLGSGDFAGVYRSAVPSRRSRPAAAEAEDAEGAKAPKEEDPPNPTVAVLF